MVIEIVLNGFFLYLPTCGSVASWLLWRLSDCRLCRLVSVRGNDWIRLSHRLSDTKRPSSPTSSGMEDSLFPPT